MSQPAPHARPRRPSPSPARTLLALAGSFTALLALVVLAAGTAVVWLHGEQDPDGWLTTGATEVATAGAALRSDDLDVDLDDAGWLGDPGDLGRLRVGVSSAGGAPVFAGVARTAEVERYLRGVEHATVTDLELRPLDLDVRQERGTRRAVARPDAQPFWRASVSGAGAQQLDWDVEDGDWSVVVMNADGTPGVRAEVRGGLRIASLGALGWGLLGGGALLGAGAATLLVLGLRTPRAPGPPAPPAQAPERPAQLAG